MIEKVVLDYLSNELNIPVVLELEDNLPDKFVVIEKTGSSVFNHIHSATLALQSYSNSLYGAAKLNEEVKSKMNSLIELGSIFKSNLNSDYNFTDTATKRYRYQAVYDVYY